MRALTAVCLLLLSTTLSAEPARKSASLTHECFMRDTGGCDLTVTDAVTAGSCVIDGYYYNVHRVFLDAGRVYQATLRGDFVPEIGVTRPDLDTFIVQAVGPAGGTATVTFTAEVSGYHEIHVGANTRNTIGTYQWSLLCDATPPTCTSSATAACLLQGRFRVSVAFLNQFANPPAPGNFLAGKLRDIPDNPDLAIFGINNAAQIEVVVRIQDTRPFGFNRFDVYYGGLTDLEYTVTVTDTIKGVTKTYRNPPGTVGGGVDRVTFTTAN
jgi:hypothetical protein